MSDNGAEVELVRVTLKDGSMEPVINTNINISLLSHALRLLNIQMDMILMGTKKPETPIVSVPPNVIDRLRK